MNEWKIGDWVALETDDGVCTGMVTKIEKSRGRTQYSVDVFADGKYHSRVLPHG